MRPGVPRSPLFLRGKRSTCCSARGRVYALASLGLRRSAGGFCEAGAALAALQGVGCTPWRPLVSAALPVGFAWQAQRLVLCKGSDVCPGVPWSPLLFAWQAQHLLLCKGSDVRPGVPWSAPLVCAALPVGYAWQAPHLVLCKASDVRPGALGPLLFAWQAQHLLLCKGSDVRPGVPWSAPLVCAALPVGYAWQAQHLVLCKGSDVRPGVPRSRWLCR